MENPFRRLKTYSSFVKLEHTVFSLPLVFSGAVLGFGGVPTIRIAILIITASIGARTFAMAINRIIDEKTDLLNPRTKNRELPRKVMKLSEGYWVSGIGCVLYFLSAALLGNICFFLSPIPILLFAAYPYLKKFSSLSHLGLGIAWSMAPLGGWIASRNSIDGLHEVGWLWLFSVLWLAGFDIIYSTLDEEFDRKAGLFSLPAKVGRLKALKVASMLHAWAFLSVYALWKTQLDTQASFFWLLGIGFIFVFQHAIAGKYPEMAFFHSNAVLGFLIFGLVVCGV